MKLPMPVLHGGHERGHDQSALFSLKSISFTCDFGHDADLRIIVSFHDYSHCQAVSGSCFIAACSLVAVVGDLASNAVKSLVICSSIFPFK